MFAKFHCAGKRVLDCPCGEGFGSNILSAVAESVLGIDISDAAIKHAAGKYQNKSLTFKCLDMAKVSTLPAKEFDVIVCFEGIEHVDEQAQLLALAGFERALKDDGLLIISTPNKHTYSDLPKYSNSFHVHEFYVDEFRSFLKSKFPFISEFGQSTVDGASIVPLAQKSDQVTSSFSFYESMPDGVESFDGIVRDPNQFVYLISVCSKTDLKTLNASGHFIIDLGRRSLIAQLSGPYTQISNLKQHVTGLNEIIGAMQNSASWRITRPLRWVKHRLTQFKHSILHR